MRRLSTPKNQTEGTPPPWELEPLELLEPELLEELELDEELELLLELLDDDELLELELLDDDEELELLDEPPRYSSAPMSKAVLVGRGSPSISTVKPMIAVPALTTPATAETRCRSQLMRSVNHVATAGV